MPLVGSLRDMTLAELLSVIAEGEKSGIITVQAEAGNGHIHVHRGRVVHAANPLRDERFGEILLKLGKISKEDLEAALGSQEICDGTRRLGSILIEMGKISKADQDDAILYQTAEAIYDLCTWQVGYFQYDPQAKPDQTGVVLPVGTLLEEVRRRARAEDRARREALPSPDAAPLRARREITPDRRELLRLSRSFHQKTDEFDPANSAIEANPVEEGIAAPPHDDPPFLELEPTEPPRPGPEGDSF
jgi:uncharacterized protein DUF4388